MGKQLQAGLWWTWQLNSGPFCDPSRDPYSDSSIVKPISNCAVVHFVQKLPTLVVALQVQPVKVGHRLHPSQNFLWQLSQRRDWLVSRIWQNSGFDTVWNHPWGGYIWCFVVVRRNFYRATDFADHGTNWGRLRYSSRWHSRSECREYDENRNKFIV